jgi:hypothetical protein
MTTNYEKLQNASDLIAEVAALLRDSGEADLREQAHKLLRAVWTAQDATWDEKQAEPELEGHS